MRIEFTCLCCEAQCARTDHTCPIGLCMKEKHVDFCVQCRKLIMKNFESQFNRPKLRVEGEN